MPYSKATRDNSMKVIVDLRSLAASLVQEFPSIQSLWLFGSRRHRTRSLRSDIDILVSASDHLRPNDLRNAIQKHCPALDLFVVEDGKAISCMNESFVSAKSVDELRGKLDALCIWSVDPSEIQKDAPFTQELLSDVTYAITGLDGGEPRSSQWSRSIQNLLQEVENEGLPVNSYVGDTVDKIGAFLLDLVTRLIDASFEPAALVRTSPGLLV
jgi:hypothetical protein